MLHLLRHHRYGFGRGLIALVLLAWSALAFQPCAFAAERSSSEAPLQGMAGHTAHPGEHGGGAHAHHGDQGATHPHAAAAPHPCGDCDEPTPIASHLLGCDDDRCLVISALEQAPVPSPTLAAAWELELPPLVPVLVSSLPWPELAAATVPLPARGPERIPASPILAFRVLRI